MPLRIATFNMENLFRRPRVMHVENWDEGRRGLEDIARLNELLSHETYSADDKRDIAEILTAHGLAERNPRNVLFRINQVRGRLYVTHQDGTLEVTARGRGHWVGWVVLATDELAWDVVRNTGRVVDAVRPDILLCVEVEDRPALERFNDQVLAEHHPGAEFPYNLLIDGNDGRGIDLGVLSRFPVRSTRSHIFDPVPGTVPDGSGGGGRVFSRDCPEYEIELPGGRTLWLLGNHLKSKGYGDFRQSARRRLDQAKRVREIALEAARRSELVVVAGDFNDTPGSAPLTEVRRDTGLRDVMTSPLYSGRPGTFGTGNPESSKIDYLMLSPALWPALRAVGVERRGVYTRDANARFDTVTSKVDQASDHAALWADLEA